MSPVETAQEPPPPAPRSGSWTFETERVLKRDHFGSIESGVFTVEGRSRPAVCRNLTCSVFWARPIAALLAAREARALRVLRSVEGVPRLLARGRGRLVRTHLAGRTFAEARPTSPEFYAAARRLLSRMHASGVTHNDTHKEANWLERDDGSPALLDFQLAATHRRRGRWFRSCALEDLRHLLKHKRKYCGRFLTATDRRLLARRGLVARAWMRGVKPMYLFVTRRLLRTRDGEGRGFGAAP